MSHGLINQTEQDYYNSNFDNFGYYQFISLEDIIDNFAATYVGEGKILQKANRADISFHAYRALQELSFDTFKSCKSQEIEVPPSLVIPLPQDYVNYVKLAYSDNSGIEHIIYPTSKTSNPRPIKQNENGDYKFQAVGTFTSGSTVIVLDKEYPQVVRNTTVVFANGSSRRVLEVSHANNVTSITIDPAIAFTRTETVTFLNSNTVPSIDPNDLVNQVETAFVLDGLSWTVNESKITAANGVGDVKVGMQFNNPDFTGSQPHTVIDVTNNIITVSSVASNTLSSQTANFVSYTKTSDTWSNYKTHKPSENNIHDYQDYQNDIYWPNEGGRFGLDPQHAQVNGSYYIDCEAGKIHFSSNLSGKTVIIKYISDSLGTHEEIKVHKFAEEAMYKWIVYGCISARIDIPEYIIRRYKKERFAETRKAKLRLSNIKLEEITQIFRGKSKQIKH